MLEWVTATSGDKVIRLDGCLLASRVDPVAEAAAWFQRRANFVAKVQTVFVLGAGCGFHIREVARRTRARILVIESYPELIDAVASQLSDLSARVTFVRASSVRELRAHETVRLAIATSFVVLDHPPSVNRDRAFFRECKSQLVGRDWGALNWQWKLKGHPDFDAQPRISGAEKPLTIYDLEQTELVQDSNERERMLLKALRELVK